MTCSSCDAELPRGAKFCPECGSSLDLNTCTACGEALKANARFCHNCGTAAEGQTKAAKPAAAQATPGRPNWLPALGIFLLVPIFAAVIILLFWQNRDPEPGAAAQNQAAPSMAAMGEVHKTLERLKSNIEKNPEDLVSIDSLAVMYAIAGSYDKARAYYERHLEIEPDNLQVKVALGMTYHSLNQTDRGLALLEEVLKVEPTHVFALFYAGDLYATKGDLKVAEKQWNKVIENYPNTEFANLAQQRIHEFVHGNSD